MTSPDSGRQPIDAYRGVRALTDRLVEPLSAEDMGLQSMDDASPAKWHMAHTTWFFETFMLKPQVAGYVPFDPHYEYLFNSYYNAVGAQYPRPRRGLISRPGVQQVRDYRAHVDEAMTRLLQGGVDDACAELLQLGLNHEQQHQELLVTDLKHGLSFNPRYAVVCARERTASTPARSDVSYTRFDGGLVEIGAEGGFHFDNEAPRHAVHLCAFELANRPVTNADFMRFVEAGGYERPDHWLSDGWAFVQRMRITAPLYWTRGDDGFEQYTLSGVLPLEPAEPVCHISHYEADAYARWAGARLPTEAEWEHASERCAAEDADALDPTRLHPREVSDADGLRGMLGGVWEWTASAYLAYPGFRPFAGDAAEYNGKFMSGQLVLRGGSCATPAGHARASYRNFFPPQARWQFSGLRLARDVA